MIVYLAVYILILSISATNVVSSSDVRQNMTSMETLITSNATTELLVNLDESLSQCGPHEIDIRELTINQIQEHFQTGKLTSVELTQCYLKRISKIDIHLKSVIEVNPDAIQIAEKADRERHTGLNQSQIHGIPILIKDNIATLDLMQTTVGAVALENIKPRHDADVVKRLRNAGAVLLGKSNPSEWAYFRGNDIPSGWSGRGGQTISPYVLNRHPSGSSSGSAVATTANLAVISFEAVSTIGVIPLAFSNDVIGPIARSVGDAAILIGVISDIDLQGCNLNISSCLPDQNFKVGILRDPFWNVSDSTMEASISTLEKTLDVLNSSGRFIVIDPIRGNMDIVNEVNNKSESIVFSHEFKYSINNYLRNDVTHNEKTLHRSIYSLADIIRFNEENPPKEDYNQDILKMSEVTDGLQNKTYLATRDKDRINSIKYLELIFNESGVDVLATPSISCDSQELLTYGAFAGYPSITVPVGVDNVGMPFELYLLGRPI